MNHLSHSDSDGPDLDFAQSTTRCADVKCWRQGCVAGWASGFARIQHRIMPMTQARRCLHEHLGNWSAQFLPMLSFISQSMPSASDEAYPMNHERVAENKTLPGSSGSMRKRRLSLRGRILFEGEWSYLVDSQFHGSHRSRWSLQLRDCGHDEAVGRGVRYSSSCQCLIGQGSS